MHEEHFSGARQVEMLDMGAPVRGKSGAMYPLLLHRVEGGGLDFVLDINEDVLIAAPDVAAVSAGKGIAIILLLSLIPVDAAIIKLIPKMASAAGAISVPVVVMVLALLLSVAVGVNVFKAVRGGNRIEPLLLNRRDGTVTVFSKEGVSTYDWGALKPFIRIVQIVHAAGGAVTYQLILADVDEATGVVRSEFIAAKGDLTGAGVERYGFFKQFMGGSHEGLPNFQLVSPHMDWAKQLAVSIWTGDMLRQRWMGEKSWTFWMAICNMLWVMLITPLQVTELIGAWISKGPFGWKETGPWPRRFESVGGNSPLKEKGGRYAEVTSMSRILLLVSMTLGTAAWMVPIGLFLKVAFR
ncbi:hypothetical protein [Stenotrophomonas cyclobalanopsidis]|uniref:hypothetical protein n=1 Tax=Stenotrophomonas cyclobalanopsidis TaxID=2771362 RepID=UPI002FDB2F04